MEVPPRYSAIEGAIIHHIQIKKIQYLVYLSFDNAVQMKAKLVIPQLIDIQNKTQKVFNAFDKVPNALWEDEYEKYNAVLEKYKDIKMLRWANN